MVLLFDASLKYWRMGLFLKRLLIAFDLALRGRELRLNIYHSFECEYGVTSLYFILIAYQNYYQF